MRVRRGVVVTTDTEEEEEEVVVEGGASSASPQSDLLPILLRTSTYVSLPLYCRGKLRPLPERCVSATVDSRGWRHEPFPAGTTTTGVVVSVVVYVAVVVTRSHEISL